MTKKKTAVRGIEQKLFHYTSYKIAIRNLQKQLDYILPNVTANYEVQEGGTGTFAVGSTTEKAAIDRIESRRALNLHEEIKLNSLIVSCIDEALAGLDDQGRWFVRERYFKARPINDLAADLGYSVPHLYKIRDRVIQNLVIPLSSIVDL